MNILESTEKLWKYFLENDTFIYPDDYSKLLIVDDKEDSAKAAIYLALNKLKESKLINSIKIKTKEYYILEKSFQSFNQTLEISAATVKSIYEIIQKYCEFTGDNSSLPDILNIKDKDIQNLLLIFYAINNKLNKNS